MSTILQALQKSSLEPAVNPAPINNNQTQYWKVAVSFALLIIIALLSTLIYLQLNPRTAAQPPVIQVPVITTTQPIPVTPQPAPQSNIVKVTFATQALPEQLPQVQKIETPVQVAATPKASTEPPKQQIVAVPVPQKKPITQQIISAERAPIVDTAATPSNNEAKQEINYEQVPNELKERFELALLLSDIEDNQETDKKASEPEEYSDGSDIRQMSSSFQHKVAPISYEAHMYSSKLEDRWIRINGEIMREGQVDSSGELELLEIQPQRSIFRVQRQSFSVESLSDWQGY